MGLAIDTILAEVTNSAALTPVTVAAGNSLSVRPFSPPAQAFLENLIIKGGQATTARLTSPLLHDAVRGINLISAQAPTVWPLPKDVGQPLQSQDNLSLQGNSGAANSSAFGLVVYYTNTGGASARLYSWGDISGQIVNIKPLEIDVAASATIGQWNDTAITTTENLLKANTDYAVLGYIVDVACALVALRGSDTSNLRVGAPGYAGTLDTANYFVDESERTGRPHIPVINAANANNTTVSVADNAAGTAVKVQLILAQLAQTLPSPS